ncbi:hypothetical protein ACFE04_020372 [Oxalis oulophora]
MANLSFTFAVIFLFLIHSAISQSPAPAPSGSANVTAILEKGGQFITFIRLLTTTQEDMRINSQIANSNQGMTVFAPTDNAFSNLKAGTLNSLTDQEKIELVQFHVLPSIYTMSQFQTVSNPLRTEAGNSSQFPLNVTTSGNNQVNVSSGVNTATVSNNLVSNSKLVVYQVDQVLCPVALFGSSAPEPAPGTPDKIVPAAAPKASSTDDTPADKSRADNLSKFSMAVAWFGFAAIIGFSF